MPVCSLALFVLDTMHFIQKCLFALEAIRWRQMFALQRYLVTLLTNLIAGTIL
jgi:hypothetical protein